jgi:hypothetical protein
MRILFNSAQILISHLQQNGYERLADEAIAVLMHVDAIAPGQQRFAQLMEQLALLAPVSGVVAAAAASEYEAANGPVPESTLERRQRRRATACLFQPPNDYTEFGAALSALDSLSILRANKGHKICAISQKKFIKK